MFSSVLSLPLLLDKVGRGVAGGAFFRLAAAFLLKTALLAAPDRHIALLSWVNNQDNYGLILSITFFLSTFFLPRPQPFSPQPFDGAQMQAGFLGPFRGAG